MSADDNKGMKNYMLDAYQTKEMGKYKGVGVCVGGGVKCRNETKYQNYLKLYISKLASPCQSEPLVI